MFPYSQTKQETSMCCSSHVMLCVYMLIKHSLVKQDVVLRTHSQTAPDLIHLLPNVLTIHKRSPLGRFKQSSEQRPADSKPTQHRPESYTSLHCSGLACTIVTEKGCYVTFIHVQGQVL